MVITSTPLSISFFGAGADYPVWYRQYSGAVLSTGCFGNDRNAEGPAACRSFLKLGLTHCPKPESLS
jgi:hypothetical protein